MSDTPETEYHEGGFSLYDSSDEVAPEPDVADYSDEDTHEAAEALEEADTAEETGNVESDDEPEDDSDGDDEGDEAPEKPAAETKKPTPEEFEEMVKGLKRKVKINGEEREVTVEELERGYQIEQAGREKFEKAAKTLREVEQSQQMMVQELQKLFGNSDADTKMAIMQNMGVDPVAFAEQLLSRHLEYETMSPEQKAMLQQRQAHEQRLKEEEERLRRERDELQPLRQQYYMKQLEEAVDAGATYASLPANPQVRSAIAQEIQRMLSPGEEITQDLVNIAALSVADMVSNQTQSLLSTATPEQLEAFLGKDALDALRQKEIAKVAAKPTPKPKTEPKKPKKEYPEYKSLEEVETLLFDYMNQ